MNKLLRGAAWLLAVSSIVWLGVLWRWQVSARDVTAADVLVYLLLLPLTVLALGLALRWAWRLAVAKAAARQAATPSTPAAPASPAASGEAARRHAVVQLLSAHLVCACADSPAALLEAAQQRRPMPGLDKVLCNADGLPVMSARIADLALDPAQSELAALALARVPDDGRRQHPAGGDPATPAAADPPPAAPAEHLQRALAALRVPLIEALQTLQDWAAMRDGDAPQVHWLLAWPPEWSDPQRALATEWVRQLLHTQDAPGAQDAPPHDEPLLLDTLATDGPALWTEADRRLERLAAASRPAVLALAACHSELGEAAIAALESRRRLFDPSRQPRGLIPGEGAAVLLLAPTGECGAAWPPPAGLPQPTLLHRPALARRDKSVEAGGSVGSQVLTETLEHALAAARLPASEVATVACDADGHSGRATELFGSTLAALPHLDASEDLCLTGTVASHGLAAALSVVAVAAERARRDGRPCLGLGLGDPHWRLAIVARPPQPLPHPAC